MRIAADTHPGERLCWTLKTGALLWNPLTGRYLESVKKDPNEIVRRPHLVGFTREIELRRANCWAGSWAGALFEYREPKCRFSPTEQRLLSTALRGWTDEELSASLGKSLPTLKKLWRSVYCVRFQLG
jgi:hypothetical protein